jgi:hypothetical protein
LRGQPLIAARISVFAPVWWLRDQFEHWRDGAALFSDIGLDATRTCPAYDDESFGQRGSHKVAINVRATEHHIVIEQSEGLNAINRHN